ncbi:Thoeris anti-defense Tad2 family protein [Methylobacterium sp. CM6244]
MSDTLIHHADAIMPGLHARLVRLDAVRPGWEELYRAGAMANAVGGRVVLEMPEERLLAWHRLMLDEGQDHWLSVKADRSVGLVDLGDAPLVTLRPVAVTGRDLGQALIWLRQGERVRRVSWRRAYRYLVRRPDDQGDGLHLVEPRADDARWIGESEDLLAFDYELVP